MQISQTFKMIPIKFGKGNCYLLCKKASKTKRILNVACCISDTTAKKFKI